MKLFCYGNENEKTVLEFSPCRKIHDIQWEDWNYADSLYITKTDYTKLLKDFIEKIFPINDPENNEIIECFDPCTSTWIGKKDWEKLIKLIEQEKITNEREMQFYNQFVKWIKEQLINVKIIVTDGW